MATLRLLPAVAALLLVAACGRTDESSDPALPSDPVAAPSGAAAAPPRATSDPALEQAVRDYSAAYLGGDGDAAHALLSHRCQRRITAAELTTTAGQAKAIGADATIETIDAEIDDEYDDEAEVTYTYSVPALDQDDQDWVLEDDVWKNDDC